MGAALTGALTKLGLKNRNALWAALAGERNPTKLTEIGAGGRE